MWKKRWLLSLLLGSTLYAGYHGLVHFSDWCYLGVSTAVAAGASAAVLPLHRRLQGLWQRAGRVEWWAGRGGRLAATLLLFGLANLLVWPLHTWPGPGGTWPWGIAALLVTGLSSWEAGSED